jgi:beta-N-acetylhexosaminidase
LRSYSENPDEVAEHVRAYIEGAHADPANRVLVCAKHFPGHGDTAVDSHLGLGKIEVDRARLDAMELKPFRAAIAAGVDSVLTAHLSVPALEPKEIPVTVSTNVMTKLLKNELGFKGIVTTDAMDMLGLSNQIAPGEAVVRAMEAGVDVLLMPPDPSRAINAVVKAVESGRLSRARIRASVEKVLTTKVRLGLHRKRLVEIEQIADGIDLPRAAERAQSTADRAITLVRDDRDLFPAKSAESSCLYVLVENRWSTLGRRFVEEIKARRPLMLAQVLDASLPNPAFDGVVDYAKTCAAVYVTVFSTPSEPVARFINSLIAGPAPVGLISFGNPYLLRTFPAVAGYVATFSTAQTSEVAMAKSLTGEIRFQGKMPITIPGLAEYGSGLTK